MKKLFLSLIICLPLIVKSQQVTRLFNGHNLDGWTIHGTEKWYVKNGELVCESGPDKEYGYLSTNKSYKNFILMTEFKLEANGNSGIFIRSSIEELKIDGWQVEVAPKGLHTGGIYESYKREWLAIPESYKEEYLNPDGWNTMVINCVGDHVVSWLNGNEMVSLHDAIIGQGDGFIALQIHAGGGIKVRWRNLRILELPQSATPIK